MDRFTSTLEGDKRLINRYISTRVVKALEDLRQVVDKGLYFVVWIILRIIAGYLEKDELTSVYNMFTLANVSMYGHESRIAMMQDIGG